MYVPQTTASSSPTQSNGSPTPVSAGSSATSTAPGEAQSPPQDPSVITGMAFRFPGAKTLSSLWDNVVGQKDLQKKMPEDRFKVDNFYHPQGTNKGTTNAKYGYFLDDPISEFDNEFFRISRQEAESMDPQQRILLEVVFEALEDAGIPIQSLRKSQTSVYVGSFTNDYNSMTTKDLTTYPKYTVTGTGNAILANRISYFYDLNGPSMTIDTACSSSLVCFHLGNQSLIHGESDISIVAGSALHFDPNIFITMTDFGMLSEDGRCRTFDKQGSGYVRGEGVCAMILKRQSTAEEAGDRIRAIVRGTGSNHDGSKSGLTLPNGAAQARLIRQTYKDSGLETNDTDYFEAHGTGTKAGDPIESSAIGSVFAPGRDKPLYVGSIKSNLGHLEGASGLAGIAKAVMSVSSGKILPNMHFNKPNPQIDFDFLKIKVPTELIDWPTNRGFRRASVNSFGYGGSNAHVVLENYSPRRQTALGSLSLAAGDILTDEVKSRPYLLPLMAHNEGAANNNVRDISHFIANNDELTSEDLALSYSVRRSRLQLCSAAVGSSRESLLADLANPKSWTTQVSDAPRLGFVFTGQGAQWYAMGRELLEKSPLFRQTIEKCDRILSGLPDRPEWTCLEELQKPKEDTRLGESLLSQPLCCALQLAIIDQLAAWNIAPAAVVGHSSGEIAAAYAAGILSFRNAIVCAYYRGLYMSQGKNSSTKGAMIAVGMTESEGKELLQPYQGRIGIAAVNSATSLTLSGDEDAVEEVKIELDGKGVFNRKLRVEQAFHSHHMVPLAPAFDNALSSTQGFQPMAAQTPMFSSVTARDSSARPMDSSYWAANMTGVVRFSDALTGTLLTEDEKPRVDVLVEIGPHPALKGPAKDVVKSLGLELPYVSSLRRDLPAFESLLRCAGELLGYGYQVDMTSVNSHHWLDRTTGALQRFTPGVRLTELPAYSWNHGEFWAETRAIRQHRQRSFKHSLLGAIVPGCLDSRPLWRNYLRLSEIPWLAGHCVQGKVIFPAAGYITMALEAVSAIRPTLSGLQLRDVVFKNALVLDDKEAGTEVLLELQPLATSAKNTSSTWYLFSITSVGASKSMIEHCRGQVRAAVDSSDVASAVSAEYVYEAQKSTHSRTPVQLYYKQLRSVGLDYGEDFRLLRGNVDNGRDSSIGAISFTPKNVICEADECIIYPTVLDSAFHVIFAAIEGCTEKALSESFVPTFIRHANFSSLLSQRKSLTTQQDFVVQCNTRISGPRVARNTLRILASEDEAVHDVLVELDGLEVTALGNESSSAEEKRLLFFNIEWNPLFSQLGASRLTSSSPSIPDLVRLFAHEVPDAALLHVTPELESAKHILAPLGGSNGQMRRFRKLNLYHTKSEQGDEDDLKALDSAWPGLVECSEPSAGRYDLIILEDKVDTAVNNLLNPGGYIITSGIAIAEDGLTSLFTSGDISIWEASKTWTESSTDPITVVLPIRLSDQTLSLLSAIRTQTPRHIETVTVGQSVPDTADVISLVSLDDDVLFDVDTEQMYLESVQALVRGPVSNVIWLTRGAAIGSLQPQQAVIGGLLRSIRSEHDDLRLVTLDLDPEAQYNSDYVSKRILQVLPTDFAEDEIADRKETLLVPRAQPDDKRNSKLPGVGNRQVVPAPFSQDSRNLALKIGKTGLLDTLSFEDDEDMQGELPADCLEVEVKASALNFRDVAAALGIIEDHRLGDEAAGIVVGVGKSVSDKDYRVGDRVIAFRPGQGAHRTRVRNPAVLCQKIGDMGFEEAAAFSLVTVTAYYSLYGVARLRRGEYCLVHAAAGGVGQMAVQLAQRVGAKVIATVGSPEKRAYIKDKFGVPDEMIFSSRDNSFVDGVMKVTSGKGCDVVLNSLAGDLLHDSWKCLAPLGRLIEIGKRDIHENTKLDMDPFRHNVTYASVDCITLFHVDPELLSEQLCKSFALLEKGEILPPGPIRTFNYGEAQQAFRALQLGKFFGKIVLTPQADELIPLLPVGFTRDNLFQADKIYLLVGGLGGIGRALSQWMFRKGARRIAFMSRSGDASSTAKETIAWLKERAVETIVFNADVAHKENVRTSIGSIKRELAGIFQAAMVLRDGPFDQMTIDDWKQCVRPKILGTTNLHEAVLDLDLDFFVCFSSMSSVIGSAGQSNYSAANCYLDALMSYRRSKGLAGATMNVGVVGDSGAVAEDEALAVILERMGYESITQSELFYQVQEAVVGSRSASDKNTVVDMHQIISGLNMRRKDVYWAQKPLFRNMYANRDLETSAAAKGTQSLTAMLKAAAGHEERIETLTAAFIQKVAAVMGTPAELIRATQPLTAYGLDSIVAVEFRKWFSNAVWLDVPLFDILGSKSIKDLIEKAASTLRLGDGENQGSSESAPSDAAQGGPRKRGARKSSQKTIARRNLEHKPISSYQSRLWFQHNVSSDASTLNFVADFSLEGEPQLPVLQATLNEMALRNDILRTKYFEGDDFSEQATASYFKAQIAFEDLSWEVDAQKTLATKTLSLRAKPIDVEEGESMNVCLFKMSNQKYRLVFSMHHINLDNGSTKPFMDQFKQIYDGISKQKDLQSIRGPRLSYSDFAVWHNEFLQGPAARSDLEWWQNNLKDIPEASMLLPFAHSKRFENRSAARRTLETAVPSNVLARLKRISAASGATPAHFVMAAFRAFIYRYTEQDDLVFLMVDGTRPHPEVSDILGFFVNLIPLRLRIEADWDFHSVLSHVTDVSFNALAHNSTPFDTILETVGVKRSTAHFPISQVTVNYQVYGKPPVIKLADFDVVDINFQDIPTPADIALEAIEDPAVGLSLKLQYDPDLYADKESQRFLDNFSVFLTSAASDHHQPVSEINMCGLQELQHLRQKCWGLQVSPDKWAGKSIVSKILETAESLPAATAIETSDRETKTYSELVTMAKTIASNLQALGLFKGDLVGVMFKPGIEMIAVLLGVIMGGFGYLPLDPDFAVDRLAHMIEETQVAIVLVEKLLPGLDRSVARVAAMVPSFDPATVASWKPTENSLDDPFYVIYTSGSTGKPKGVLLTHGNTRAMLSSHNAIHDFSWNDRILFVTSFTWDVSVSQIWGALTSGATMLLAKEDVRKDPGALASFLRDAEVTVTYTTPTQYAAMLSRGKEELANCSTHRTAIFAGEALSQRLVKEVYDHGAAGLTVYNEFGPSEATVQTTCYKASYPENIEGGVPIGSGLPNCSHYAIDPKMRPVPASAPGELCEGGPQVGAGYIARPEATREVYVEDSFASEAFRSQGWTRMYRTGDRVRFLDGGQLEYLGRISGDSQLKLRGFRIDLGEIENELISAASRFPEQLAADAVVVPLSVDEANDLADGVDDRQLVAFLVAKDTMKAFAIQTIVNEIHSYLKRRLNSYMLPSGYQIIDNFPTLPSGKRSRKLLAEVGLDLVMPVVKTESSESNQTPDGVEVMDIITKVIELFRVVLKLRPEHDINPSLSFFDLGGHSLLGLRLTSQIKKAFNTKVELREIVLDMTPINIGRVIAAKLGVATTAPITPSRTDWEKEASLPDEPAFYPRSDAASFCGSGSKGILLTGADSVTGSHLLGRLLAEDSIAPISIIGTSSKLAEGDVLKMLQDRGISVDRDTFTARVDCLPGNLTTPNFGLTSDAFVRLGQSTSAVLHFGSVVSLLQGVSDLRLPNIEATKDIIRLAALNPEAEIHYLSSWSVVHLQNWHSSQGRNGWDGQTLKHEKVQDHYVPTGEDFAYFKTRWAAEALLSQAAQRGIPTNIYRSSGLDESFNKTEDNFYLGMIKSMVDSGMIPQFEDNGFCIDLVTPQHIVDVVTRRLKADLVRQRAANVFHISSMGRLSLDNLPEILGRLGLKQELQLVPIETWLNKLEERGEVSASVTRAYIEAGHRMFSLDDRQTRAVLGSSADMQQTLVPSLQKLVG